MINGRIFEKVQKNEQWFKPVKMYQQILLISKITCNKNTVHLVLRLNFDRSFFSVFQIGYFPRVPHENNRCYNIESTTRK